MIRGMHAMYYSSHAEALRDFFRDKLNFPAVDVGEGWLIFDMPEADMGCHPLDNPNSPPSGTAEVSFYCDDLQTTVAELKAKGVEFSKEIMDWGFGLVTFFKVPGDFEIMLYQPHYKK